MQNKIGNIQLIEISKLKGNPRNPNTHSPDQIERIAKVIKKQGWRMPIVVSNQSGFIVSGHGRLEAAKLLGHANVPVSFQDFANEAEEKAHLIADNRLADLSELDNQALKDLIEDLDTGEIDLEFTGFNQSELDNLMSQFYQGKDSEDVEETDFPDLQNGEKAPFQQKTFILHDEQAEEVDAAIEQAKSLDLAQSAINENRNGNAIFAICKKFNLENTNKTQSN